MAKAKFFDETGSIQEAVLDVTDYKAAADAGMSVPQYINKKYKTDSAKFGTAFDQIVASEGLFVRKNAEFGIRPPTMADVFAGKAEMQAGVITRDAAPASRIIFPAVFLEAVEDRLKADTKSYTAQWDKMIAISDSINGPRFEQPLLNYSNPAAAVSQGISQLALPASMLSITVSDVARKIPTFALGLEVSYEALASSTLDLVTMGVARQAEVERASRVDGYIQALVSGDADMGTIALVAKTQTALDAAPVGGAMTHKAWVKWLRTNWRKRHIDTVMCDLATAIKIENRTGKPVIVGDNPNSKRINPNAEVMNPQWQDVNIFLLEDGVIAADNIVGIDSRYAIRRVRNSQADYQAVEEFVLRKSRAMRFDFGEICYRMFDEAFDQFSIT